jgi:hypothetical protein
VIPVRRDARAGGLIPPAPIVAEATLVVSVALLYRYGVLLLLPLAARVRRPLPPWAPAATIVPAACIAIAGATGTGRESGQLAVAAIVATGFLMLARPLLARAIANAKFQAQRGDTSRTIAAAQEVAGEAHTRLSTVLSALEELRAGLVARSPGELRLADALDEAIDSVRTSRSRWPASAEEDAGEAWDESASTLVDRWARREKVPPWIPARIEEWWPGGAGAWLDSVRYLHTREIERASLVGTLVVRAGLVLVAPLSAFIVLGAPVPFATGLSVWRNAAWLAAAVWFTVVATIAPRIVERVMSDDSRLVWILRVAETGAALATVIAVPSWLAFAAVAGPVNWFARPQWRLRTIASVVAISLGALAFSLRLADGGMSSRALVGSILLAGLTLFLISCSYGLMFPLVLAYVVFVLPAWGLRRMRTRRRHWRARIDPVAHELAVVVDTAAQESTRSASAGLLRTRLEELFADVHELEDAPQPGRWSNVIRKRSLRDVVVDALEHACDDPEPGLRWAEPVFVPVTLAEATVRNWRGANDLERTVARIAAEAARHGEHEVRCYVRLTAGGTAQPQLHVRVENDLRVRPVTAVPGSGVGAREIVAALGRLPGGELRFRGLDRNEFGLEVYGVEFALNAGGLSIEGVRAA